MATALEPTAKARSFTASIEMVALMMTSASISSFTMALTAPSLISFTVPFHWFLAEILDCR